MNTKSAKHLCAGLIMFVIMIACIAIGAICMPTVAYAD